MGTSRQAARISSIAAISSFIACDRAFDRRHRAAGVGATADHPGGIATELGRYAYSESGALQNLADELNAEHAAAGKPLFSLKTIPQGVATSVWAGVVAPAEAVGGCYCENCHVAELLEGEAASEGVRSYALDPERAKALWFKSEEMVGERF
jgi:hypothetical protein